MRDLSALKERIDHAERQLEAAESDRRREGDALMKMWRQIRHRFVTQEQEIAGFRNQIEQLTQRNEELSALVETMLASIEAGASRTHDETAAKIAGMAQDLLTQEFPPRALDEPPIDELPLDAPNDRADDREEDVLELSDAAEDTEPSFDHDDPRGFDNHDPQDLDQPPPPETQSPGIRGLVRRFEAAMQRSSRRDDRHQRVELGAPTRDDEDDQVILNGTSDREIEDLRKELRGLRRRMTDAATAP